MKRIAYILTGVLAALVLTGCSKQKEENGNQGLHGVWMLKSMQYWSEGEVENYDTEGDTRLRIYDDSCYYECRVLIAPSGKTFEPRKMEHYTLIERGPGDYLYLQEGNTHPLSILGDTAIMIQETGSKYTWLASHDYDARTIAKIKDIIRSEVQSGGETSHRYMFTYAERELEAYGHRVTYWLMAALVAIVLFVIYFYYQWQGRRRVERALSQLQQEREAIPEPIREAMSTIEDDFHQSEFYHDIRQKIGRGDRLSPREWHAIDEQLRRVYPRFNTTLLTLSNMSATELQVCQLLKLNATPTEIATVLCKDKSSISSIRSRLYGKVFGHKGTGKEWDEFILSL